MRLAGALSSTAPAGPLSTSDASGGRRARPRRWQTGGKLRRDACRGRNRLCLRRLHGTNPVGSKRPEEFPRHEGNRHNGDLTLPFPRCHRLRCGETRFNHSTWHSTWDCGRVACQLGGSFAVCGLSPRLCFYCGPAESCRFRMRRSRQGALQGLAPESPPRLSTGRQVRRHRGGGGRRPADSPGFAVRAGMYRDEVLTLRTRLMCGRKQTVGGRWCRSSAGI